MSKKNKEVKELKKADKELEDMIKKYSVEFQDHRDDIKIELEKSMEKMETIMQEQIAVSQVQ